VSDIFRTLAQGYGVLGLKPRSVATIIEKLKGMGIECSDADGFLAMTQGSTPLNVAQVLQSYFQKHPADFVGHVGEIRYKSDVPQDAKVAFIREHGYQAWAALPVNENSPTAKNVMKPVVASTEMTRTQWMQLTAKEKTEAIANWGRSAVATVEGIMARK
jgi:hypothetical protein